MDTQLPTAMLFLRALPSVELGTLILVLLTGILAAVAVLSIVSYIWNRLAVGPRICSELASLDRMTSTIAVYNHLKDKNRFPEGLRDRLVILDEKCWR